MHLERIRQDYKQEDVEVAFVVAGADDEVRSQRLPSFKQDFAVSYTVLDDKANTVATLHKLNPNAKVAKNLIIDREGMVQLAGEFTPLTEMTAKLDSLLEAGERTSKEAK